MQFLSHEVFFVLQTDCPKLTEEQLEGNYKMSLTLLFNWYQLQKGRNEPRINNQLNVEELPCVLFLWLHLGPLVHQIQSHFPKLCCNLHSVILHWSEGLVRELFVMFCFNPCDEMDIDHDENWEAQTLNIVTTHTATLSIACFTLLSTHE